LSLDAGKAQPPFGTGRAGGRAMAVTAAVAAALVLAACGSGTSSLSSDVLPAGAAPAGAAASSVPASASQTLSETGSSLMAPLFALWAPAYHSRFSQVTLHTVSSSSGEGISSAAAGKADIGASDAFLSPATLARYSHLVNTSQPSATRAQDLRAFLAWAVTSGTAQLARVNFQPLPPPIVTLSDAQIARIRG
jgi:ABC-type phosphate transport system substrate-binding protein